MTELSVEISADIKKLEKQSKKVRNELKGIGDAAEDSQKKIGKFDTGSSQMASTLKKTDKQAGNTNATLMEFNRVIQDAPFGIQGVSNNIQQLTGNFQNLVRRSGGTLPALKSLATAFVGPAGVLFAISAVTSALVAYGDKIFKSTSLTKEFTKASSDLVASALSEASSIRSLFDISENINLSYGVREKALKKLRDQYPEHLGNLSLEKIKSKEASEQVNKLTGSLLDQAKVRGIQATLQKKIDSSPKLTEGLIKQQQAAKKVEAEIERLSKTYKEYINVEGTSGLGERTTKVFQQINKNLGGTASGIGDRLFTLVKDFEAADKELKTAESEFSDSIGDLEDILKNFTLKSLGINSVLELEEVTVIGDEKLKQSAGETVKKLNLEEIFKLDQSKITGVFTDPIREELERLGLLLDQAPKMVEPKLSNLEQSLRDFNERAKLSFDSSSLSSTIQNFSQQIGQGLGQGASFIESMGNALSSMFGGFLQRMGALLIEYGTLAVVKGKLDVAIASGGPISIAAGLAAIAVGSLLTAAGAALGSASTSGLSGDTSSSTGSSVSTTSVSSTSSDSGTVVFKISGRNLIGVLNRELGANGRLGGDLALG